MNSKSQIPTLGYAGMDNNATTVAICNFNTTELTNDCIQSIFSNFKSKPFNIVVFDNSDKIPFTTQFDVRIIDNTHGKYIDFSKATSIFSSVPSKNNYASLKHAMSI